MRELQTFAKEKTASYGKLLAEGIWSESGRKQVPNISSAELSEFIDGPQKHPGLTTLLENEQDPIDFGNPDAKAKSPFFS